jgi:hypothetical protein
VCLKMRKPFRSQNAAVTAAFFIAPLLPSIFIPLVGPWRLPPDVMGALVVYLIALPFVFAFGLPGAVGAATGLAFWAVVCDRKVATDSSGSERECGRRLRVTPLSRRCRASIGHANSPADGEEPEPGQSTAKNWVEPFRRRRE